MRRLGLVALTCLVIAAACGGDDGADEPEARTIAVLRAVPGSASTEPALVEELRQAGYVEGRNLRIIAGDVDIAFPDPDEAREAIAEWQADGVDLILALSSGGATIAREVAADTDILFISNDPSATGLVEDEDAPEGRLTGVTFRVPADRTLDLARRLLPDLQTVGLAHPADDPAALANLDALDAAATSLGMNLITEAWDDPARLGPAIAALAAAGADLLVLSTSPLATVLLDETLELAASHGLPVAANNPLARSVLLSLFPDTAELGRQLGRQAARLLSGSDPSAVPVEDPRRFDLTLNAVVAAELGIELPADVVREATEVIR